jgi:hypothetical protein
MSFYSNELQVGKFQVKNLLMFQDFISNLSHWIVMCHKTKPLQENPLTLENLSCTKPKFHLKLATMVKTLFDTLETWSFQQLENLCCTNFKLRHWNSQQLEESTKFFKLQCWKFQELEELSSTHFQLKTWNLNTWITFFHTWELTTLWRSLFHTSH